MQFRLFDISYVTIAEFSSPSLVHQTFRLVGPMTWIYCVQLFISMSFIWGQFILEDKIFVFA
jgi:hypothetical protein